VVENLHVPKCNEGHQFSMIYYVYILQAPDGYLYTGTTKNLAKRLERHNRGRGGRFTKGRRPLRLRYYEEYADLRSAMQREIKIKKLSRAKKQELIDSFAAR
jgi:putative endonuclease